MKHIVLERDDFKIVQDGSGESFFDDILANLGIPADGRAEITTIDLGVDSYETE